MLVLIFYSYALSLGFYDTICAKLFEVETKMKALSSERIVPQFGEHKNIRESNLKPELISYWVRDSVTVFF